MRYRRISHRYIETVGRLSRAFEAEVWAALRPRAMISPYYRPPADICETEQDYIVTIELPGVCDEEMDVFIHPDALVVSGRRNCPCVEGAHYHASEIRYGPFRFDMALPPNVDAEHIEAKTERGLLRVRMPKRVAVNPSNVNGPRVNS